MSRTLLVQFCVALCLVVHCSPSLAREPIAAGETLELKEDLVLRGEDRFEANGSAGKRCTITGNGFCIRSEGNWTGVLKLEHCDLKGLGAAVTFTEDKMRILKEFPALQLTSRSKGSVDIQHCVLDACGAVHIQNDGESTTVFSHNTVLENTLAHALLIRFTPRARD